MALYLFLSFITLSTISHFATPILFSHQLTQPYQVASPLPFSALRLDMRFSVKFFKPFYIKDPGKFSCFFLIPID